MREELLLPLELSKLIDATESYRGLHKTCEDGSNHQTHPFRSAPQIGDPQGSAALGDPITHKDWVVGPLK